MKSPVSVLVKQPVRIYVAVAMVLAVGWLSPANAKEKELPAPSAELRVKLPPLEQRISRSEVRLDKLETELQDAHVRRQRLGLELAEALAAEARDAAPEVEEERGIYSRIFDRQSGNRSDPIRNRLDRTNSTIADIESEIGHVKTQLATLRQQQSILQSKIKYVDAWVDARESSGLVNMHGTRAQELEQERKDAFAYVRTLTNELSKLRGRADSQAIIAGKTEQLRAAEQEAVRLDRELDHHRYERMRATRRSERSQKELQDAYTTLRRIGHEMSDSEVRKIVAESRRERSAVDSLLVKPLRSIRNPFRRGEKAEDGDAPARESATSRRPSPRDEAAEHSGPKTEWH